MKIFLLKLNNQSHFLILKTARKSKAKKNHQSNDIPESIGGINERHICRVHTKYRRDKR